jgi:hypothetical protein
MLLALAGVVTFAAPAFAAEPDQATVEQYQTELEEYRGAKGADAAKKDIEMVQKWLDEAAVLVANGDDGAAKRRLKRVEFGLDLVRAIVAAEQVRMAAEEQEAAAYTAPETSAKLKAEIEKLLEQKQQLQNDLAKLKR